MSEWKEYRLIDLGEIITGKTPSSKFPDEFGIDMPFVTPTDYKNYHKWIYFANRKLSNKGIEKLKNKVLPPKSVLATCIGSDMGKIAINKIPVITNQQINSIIPNHSIIEPNFLYYKLIDIYDILRSYGQSGTALPIVNKGDFENITIEIPLLPKQHSIACILSSLDDKIDLLHRQNKTLEQMGEALFRQWFVEEENETIKLGTCIKTTSGGTPSRKKPEYFINGSYKWVKSKELLGSFIIDTEESITNEAINNSSAKLLPKYSILLAMYGATVGEFSILGIEAACNQAVCALLPNEQYPFTFLFCYLKYYKEHIINQAIGSAQQNISQILIKDLDIPLADKRIIDFHGITKKKFDKILLNIKQIQTLQKLRDTLLPKLMSRGLNIKE